MTKVDILQGTLDMLVLKTLSNDPMHGFAIALRIRQLTDEVIQIGEGSLYPALYRMELKGWIKAEWGVTENNRRAKYYKLTRTGRKQLEGEVSSYNRLTEAIAKVLQTAYPKSEAARDEQTFAISFPICFATLAPTAFAAAPGKIRARDGGGDALPSRNADRAEPGVRDGGGRSALCRPATIRQSNLAEGGEPRDVEFEVYRDADSGPALRRANVGEESRLHFACRADPGVGHRLDHHHLQRDPEHFAGPVPLQGCASSGHHPDSRYEQQPSGRTQLVPVAGIPRLPGAEPRVRRSHRSHPRRRSLRQWRRDGAVHWRLCHAQRVQLPRYAGATRSRHNAGRRQAGRAAGLRDGPHTVGQAIQPRPEHSGQDFHAQRDADDAGRDHAAALHLLCRRRLDRPGDGARRPARQSRLLDFLGEAEARRLRPPSANRYRVDRAAAGAGLSRQLSQEL